MSDFQGFTMGGEDYAVERPAFIVDVYGVPSFDYANSSVHTVQGFLHETSDNATGEPPHGDKGEVRKGVFTCLSGADVLKGDVIHLAGDDTEKWIVNETPKNERNPFTGWKPTMECAVSLYV